MHRTGKPLLQRQRCLSRNSKCQLGTKAAGVVIREPDGRVWVVAPSNAFGGYKATFPKGRWMACPPRLLRSWSKPTKSQDCRCACVSIWWMSNATQSYTRYFLAERVGGNPANMGWESQAVMLVPEAQLAQVLNSPNDVPIIDALKQV